MKNKIYLIALFACLQTTAIAQFTDAKGNEVSSCNCMDPVDFLEYTVTLPENYNSYDYIQFVAFRNTEAISSATFTPSELPGSTVKLSVLNPNQKALRTLLGKEYGRYRGNDFNNISYNSMCEFILATELHIISLGIKQIGTETTYELDGSKTRVTAKTVNIYDGGVELTRSAKVAFNKK